MLRSSSNVMTTFAISTSPDPSLSRSSLTLPEMEPKGRALGLLVMGAGVAVAAVTGLVVVTSDGHGSFIQVQT